MSIIGESLIYGNKVEAIESLYSVNLSNCFDGQEIIARYDKGGVIASVIGLVHKTNGIENIEIKGDESENTGSAGKKFVIKKAVPVFQAHYLNYFFQGNSAKHQVPKLRDGDVLQMVFPPHFRASNCDMDEFNSIDNMHDVRNFIMQACRIKIYGSENGEMLTNLLWALVAGYVEIYCKYIEGEAFIVTIINRFSEVGDPESGVYGCAHNGTTFESTDNLSYEERRGTILPNFSITMRDTYCPLNGIMVEAMEDGCYLRVFDKDLIESYGGTVDPAYEQNPRYYRTLAKNGVFGNYVLVIDDREVRKIRDDAYWNYEQENNPIKVVQLDLRERHYHHFNDNGITTETTSPGFRIENNKIKCYKASSLRKVIENVDEDFHGGELWYPFRDPYDFYEHSGRVDASFVRKHILHVKDGTVFYYHPRGIHNGMAPNVVTGTHVLLSTLFGSRHSYGSKTKMYKEEGRAEYLGKSWIGNTNKENTDEGENVSSVRAEYIGIDANTNMWCFRVNKSETTWGFKITKIGVKLIGTDGFWKEGYMTVKMVDDVETNVLASGGGRYNVCCDALYLKDIGEVINCDAPGSSEYTASIKVTYATFDFIREHQSYWWETRMPTKPIRFSSRGNQPGRHARAKWKILNRRKTRVVTKSIDDTHVRERRFFLPSGFIKSYFNTCRYYKKFKGVKSELPEFFYTR